MQKCNVKKTSASVLSSSINSIKKKKLVRDERDGITRTSQVSHGFALKLLTDASVKGYEQ